jgi:hypothetical protein
MTKLELLLNSNFLLRKQNLSSCLSATKNKDDHGVTELNADTTGHEESHCEEQTYEIFRDETSVKKLLYRLHWLVGYVVTKKSIRLVSEAKSVRRG